MKKCGYGAVTDLWWLLYECERVLAKILAIQTVVKLAIIIARDKPPIMFTFSSYPQPIPILQLAFNYKQHIMSASEISEVNKLLKDYESHVKQILTDNYGLGQEFEFREKLFEWFTWSTFNIEGLKTGENNVRAASPVQMASMLTLSP